MTYELGFNLDYDIVHAQIAWVLEQDRLSIESQRKATDDGRVSGDFKLVTQSLAFNLFERSYEQSKTLKSLLNGMHSHDISSIACCLRSQFENLIDYLYLFNMPILDSEIGDDGVISISIEGCRMKYVIQEMFGASFLIKNKNLGFSDVPVIVKSFAENHFEDDFDHKCEYLKDFDDSLILDQARVAAVTTNVRSKFNDLRKMLLKADFEKLSKKTHAHKIYSMIEILNVNGYSDELQAFYSYLSDHTHVGKASLVERSYGLYNTPGSETVKFFNKLNLFLECQFYLVYTSFNQKYFDKKVGIQDTYHHDATGVDIDTIKILHHWVNIYRRDEMKRDHFI